MSIAIITGSSGLVGSATTKMFHEQGMDIVGIDNHLRKYFFGAESDTEVTTKRLESTLSRFTSHSIDIRDQESIFKIFEQHAKEIAVVIHTAGQPSHDWAAREPFTDFTVNANGTLVLLEATRRYCPEAAFIFTSTNKVYGDTPNALPLAEHETRWEIAETHPFSTHGIDESMSIDHTKHSLFGASKVAGDILTQEYGRYFGMNTAVFRCGCLTGPAHASAELHGFLAYLVKCAVEERPYTIYGYKGKQVRDNIHADDLARAFWHFSQRPQSASVYNMGGSRFSNCSVLEAINSIGRASGKLLDYQISDEARSGDHIWWISDVRKFQHDYPEWTFQYNLEAIVQELVSAAEDHAKI